MSQGAFIADIIYNLHNDTTNWNLKDLSCSHGLSLNEGTG